MKVKILKPRKRSMYLQVSQFCNAGRWRWEIWTPGRVGRLVAMSGYEFLSPNKATRAARVLFKAIVDERIL